MYNPLCLGAIERCIMDYNYYYKIIMAYTLVCTIHTVFVCHRKMLSTKLNSFSLKQTRIIISKLNNSIYKFLSLCFNNNLLRVPDRIFQSASLPFHPNSHLKSSLTFMSWQQKIWSLEEANVWREYISVC